MDGILNILKPPGMTSHDVVAFLRRIAGQRKVGHAGTLDPGASGVLVVCLGRATRSVTFLADCEKHYRAEVVFGIGTDTQDVFGRVLRVTDASHLTGDEIVDGLRALQGKQMQTPPMASALKHKGRRLYELARRGEEVRREARPVEVFSMNVVRLTNVGSRHPRALVDIHCSKGTYVRTLCHDAGRRLGVGGCMSFLVRVGVGNFRLKESFALEDVRVFAEQGTLDSISVDVATALAHLPAVEVRQAARSAVVSGRTLYEPGVAAMPAGVKGHVRLMLDGSLLAVAESKDESTVSFRPVWVWAGSEKKGGTS